MTLARSCAGRIRLGAWRSRKYVLWTACLMASAFLLYVQYMPGSPGSGGGPGTDGDRQQQQHRSLHSFQRYGVGVNSQLEPHSRGPPPRVRFIDAEEKNKKLNQLLVAPVRSDSESGLQQRYDSATRLLQEKNAQEDKPGSGFLIKPQDDSFRDPKPFGFQQQETAGSAVEADIKARLNYVGNAAAEWNGGSFRYNPYGEPVYNHDNRPNYIPKERVVHFDLKGAPPLSSVYKSLIPWLAKNGATSILLEYEDMFPWEGPLAFLAAKNHYTKEDVKMILEICEKNGIRVIPLVQTFGHLEYALKLPKFSYLREVPGLPQALCPSQSDSHWLVQTMIDQVMALHKGAEFLHIGCDEVFQMGECDKCRLKTREDLFLEHVSKTAKYVRDTHKATPIIWHDMLGHVSDVAMKDYKFGELVEPMVWVYAEDIYRFAPPSLFTKFAQVFKTIWGASAFKGAFGEQSTVPNVRRHLDNNLNWLDVLASEAPKFVNGIRGLVLTGWQRHDHFAVLCELFPSALPSLAVNLLATSHGFFNSTVFPKISEALGCMHETNYQTDFNIDADPFLWDKFSWCYFDGAPMFKVTARLDSARREVRAYMDRVSLTRAWLTEYNRRHNFTSPMRVDEDLEELPMKLHTVTLLLKSAKQALSDWFDEWTTGEWIEQHIWPLLKQLQDLQRDAESMKAVKTWPVRPLPLLPQLETFGISPPPPKGLDNHLKEQPRTVYEKKIPNNL